MDNFIILLLFLICITVSLVGCLKKSIFKPHYFFCIEWSLILFVFLINQDRYYTISLPVQILLLSGSISFILGSIVSTHQPNRLLIKRDTSNYEIRTVPLAIFSILAIFTLSITAIENIQYLMMGMDFNEIMHKRLQDQDSSRHFLITVIMMLLTNPFVYVAVPILGYELCRKNKRWWIILFMFLIEVLFVLQSGRRSMFIYIIPALLFIVINEQKIIKSKKYQRKLFCIFILFVALTITGISWLSFQRETSFSETGVDYIAGCIPSFSERVKQNNTWYCGSGSLHGFLVPIIIGRNFFLHSYPIWWQKLDYLVEAPNSISIGPIANLNAFNTMFYVPYLDFGFLGVIVISFIVGIIYGKSYKKYILYQNVKNGSIYVVLLIGLVGSMYTLYFTQAPYALSFFYLVYLFKRN